MRIKPGIGAAAPQRHMPVRRSMLSALFALAVVPACTILAPAPVKAEKADYFIAANPSTLFLLNRFQQDVSDEAKAALPAGTPFRIEKRNETMGDELTRAHRVTYGGTTWYIILSDAGTPRGAGTGEALRLYAGCTVQGDSIAIRQSNRLSLQGAAGPVPLYEQDVVYRHFLYRGRCYAQRRADGAVGWTDLKPAAAWGPLQINRNVQPAGLGDLARNRIKERIADANTAMRNLTAFFNRQTGDILSPPRWDIDGTGDSITCTFSGTAAELAVLSGSTGILVDDLRNIVLGKPFEVALRSRTILISKEKN